MTIIGKLDLAKYKCVAPNIITDEVIITEERILHIRQQHPGDYERFCSYLPSIIADPDYIIADKRPNTAIILKGIIDCGEKFRLSLRLITSEDDQNFKNSVLTFWKTHEKEWNRLIRNKDILYKKE